uniref:Uncharacterized protein n=1 Tax=Alexandrium andersonii TaxID=327968 RepID=A0A7S2IMR5_9DINO|mmetsp:Transcript_8594/g.19423  ORF Transcript_8594/g.19423 Transcript_8594/m.19423 type:complete len:108 (+) Transcript_8594:343-666(+)
MVPAPYPSHPLAQLGSGIVGTMQIMLMGLLFMVNEKMLPEGVRENKMATVMGVFFMSSMASSALTKTNAFEIYVGRKLVFSKLKTDRMPNMRDLVKGFKSAGMDIEE